MLYRVGTYFVAVALGIQMYGCGMYRLANCYIASTDPNL